MKKWMLAALLSLPTPFLGAVARADGPDAEAVATRYHQVLLRQPRRGTAFDQLYRLYLDAGKLDELVSYYEGLARREPEDEAAAILLGLVRERLGKDEAALKAFDRAAALAPKDYYPPYCRALILAERHRDDEAAEAYRRALANRPPRSDLLEINKRLGRLYARQGKLDRARKVWAGLAAQFPDDRFTLEELASLLAEEGQHAEAIGIYERLAKLARLDPYNRLMARVEIGQIQIRQGKLKTAIATFDDCLAQVDPESWMARDLRRRIEEVFLRSDDLTGLAAYYRERLKRQPDDLNAMVRLASASARLEKRDEALEQYRAAIKRAPGRKDLREALINELVRAERFADARAEASDLVEKAPKDPDALKRLGELELKAAGPEHRAEGQARALAAWRRIAEARPAEASAALQVAELCRQAAGIAPRTGSPGDPKDWKPPTPGPLSEAALEFYREAARRAPADPEHHAHLGEFLHALGRDAEARAAWSRMADPPRDNVESLRRLAETLAAAGMLDPAIAAADRALARGPDRYDLHALAAELRTRAKKFDDALKHIDAMEKAADTPYFEGQALERRVQLLGVAGRLEAEAAALEQRLNGPGATMRDAWLAALIDAEGRRWEGAGRHLDRALQLAPDDPRLLRLRARVQADAGDLDGATKQLRRLADLEPKDRTTHLEELTRVLGELGRLDDAKRAAEELVQAAPARTASYSTLAGILFRRGEVEPGLETLRRAVRLDPRDAEIRVALARALAEHDRADEAIEHDWRAFELAEDLGVKINIVGTLAELGLSEGKFEQLIERLKRLRRQQEDPLGSTLCLVEAYRRAEDYDGARRELATLLVRRPDDRQVLEQLVSLAESMEDLDEAIVQQQKVVAAAPERANLEHLARLQLQAGRRDEANATWARIAREAKDADTLLAVLDHAASNQDHKLIVTVAGPEWARRPDDWRFGIRLAEAQWHLQRPEAARAIFEAIRSLPPSNAFDKSSSPPRAPAAATVLGQPARGTAAVFQVPMFVNLARVMVQNGAQHRARFQNQMPTTLDQAQILALTFLLEDAKHRERKGEWLDAINRRAVSDLGVLRRLALILQAEGDLDEARPLLERWVARSPDDADARVALFHVHAADAGNAPSGDKAEAALGGAKAAYEWLAERRPDLAAQVRQPYVNLLVNRGAKDDARAVIRRGIAEADDANDVLQISFAANQLQDLDLFEAMIDRAADLERKSSIASGRYALPNLYQQYINVALARQEWDRVLDVLERFLVATQPHSLKPLATNVSTILQPAGGNMHFSRYIAWNGRQALWGGQPYWGNQPAVSYNFPAPSSRLDAQRFQVLYGVHQALRNAELDERLAELLDRRSKESEGIARQCWELARSYIDWWDGERDAALDRLAKLVEAEPADDELRVLEAQALGASGAFAKALAVVGPIRVPFGKAAAPLEQLRLDLALKVDEESVARQSALRLFGMRLSQPEQAALAETLRRLGLATQGRQLEQRAEQAARRNPQMLYNLVLQHGPTDPKKAAEFARALLLQARRTSTPNPRNEMFRGVALRALRRTGELAALIAQAEEQLEKSPKAVQLIEDLAEYYAADERPERARAMERRVLEARPNDPATRLRLAQQESRHHRFTEAVDLLAPVWAKEPVLLLQQSHLMATTYSRAGRADDLAGALRKLKGHPAMAQWGLNFINSMQNLGTPQGVRVKDLIAIERAVVESVPEGQRPQARQMFAQILANRGREADAFEVYKASLFPDPKAESLTPATRSGGQLVVGRGRGGVFPALDQVAEMAERLGKLDDLSAEARRALAIAEYTRAAELLEAMIARRQGDEEPLVSLGRRARDDREFAEAIAPERSTVEDELAACRGEDPLRLALSLWEQDQARAPKDAGPDANRARNMANVLEKLGARDRARAVLLAELDKSAEVSNPNPQWAALARAQVRQQVADGLRALGFPLDAVPLYDAILRDPEALSNPFGNAEFMRAQARVGIRQCVEVLLHRERPEARRRLAEALDGSGSLAPWLVVTDPVTEAERNQFGWQLAAVGRGDAQLLPSLLVDARHAGTLDRLAATIDRRRNVRPDDPDLKAIAALIALEADRPEKIIPLLDEWGSDAGSRKSEWPERPGAWLVIREALRRPGTRARALPLAEAIANAAGRGGNAGRQQSANEALIEAITAEGGDLADGRFRALIERHRNQAALREQVAQVQFRRGRPDEAIAALGRVWKTEPQRLLNQIARTAQQYLDAGRADALAEGLRQVQDPNLKGQYHWAISNSLATILARARDLDQVLIVARVLAEFAAGPDQRPQFAAAIIRELGRRPRTAETLAAFQALALPADRAEGSPWQVAPAWIDLATRLGKLDEVEAACRNALGDRPGERPRGELLLAIVRHRRGDLAPLLAIADRVIADPTAARGLGDGLPALRDELTRARAPEALRRAVALWKGLPGTASQALPPDRRQAAELWIRLGDRDKARATWLAALDEPIADNPQQPGSREREDLGRRQSIAQQLAAHGFLLDALDVLAPAFALDTDALESTDPLHHQLAQAAEAGRRTIRKILEQGPDPALGALLEKLRTADQPDDLAGILASFDPPPGERTDEPRSLAVALIDHAAKVGRLDDLGAAVAEARRRHPDDPEFRALGALLALAFGKRAESGSILLELADRARAQPEIAAGAAVWLATREAIRRSGDPDVAWSLAEAVAASASSRGRQYRARAVLGTAAESLPDRARRLVPDDDALGHWQLGRALLRVGKADEGIAALDHAWATDPTLMLNRLAEVVATYAEAGRVPDVARALRAAGTEGFGEEVGVQALDALEVAARKLKNDEDTSALFHAAKALMPSNPATALQRLGTFFEAQGKKALALDVYRELVLPPTGPTRSLPVLATDLTRLAAEVGSLEALAAECRTLQAGTPDWAPNGSLLLAMLARRDGREEDFGQLVDRYRNDPGFARVLQPSLPVLRSELANCRSRPALELARDLDRQETDRQREHPNDQPDFELYDQLTGVLVALGARDQVPQVWLEYLEHAGSFPSNPGYLAQYLFEQRGRVAGRLADQGFPIEALRLLETNLGEPAADSEDGNPRGTGNTMLARHRKLVHALMTDRSTEALDRLEADLAATGSAPDLAAYFAVVAEPWTPSESASLPGGSSWAQLLPTLLEGARQTGRLDRLAGSVASARGRFPDHEPLDALAALVALARGDRAASETMLAAWADRLEAGTIAGDRPEPLILARAASTSGGGLEVVPRLLTSAFHDAGRRGDVARQAWLIDAAADPETETRWRAADPADFPRIRAWHLQEAESAERARNWAGADRHLDALIQAEPEDWTLYARRALARAGLGDRDAAAADYRAAIGHGAPARPALILDGDSDRVLAPHMPFDTFATFTVEAWAFRWNNSLVCQGKAGDPENSVWLALGPPGSNHGQESCGWESGAGENTEAHVGDHLGDGWNHIAMVFDGARQLLFVNGRLVRSVPAPGPGRLDPARDLQVGTSLFEPLNFGAGLIGPLRISTVARYSDDFEPEPTLRPDGDTALLFDFDEPDGPKVIDRSGHGRDGRIEGATRVRP